MRHRTPIVLIALVSLSACTTIPDQSNLTGRSNVDLVNNFRCEAQTAFARHLHQDGIADSAISFGLESAAQETNEFSGGASLLTPLHAAGSLVFGLNAGESKLRRGYTKVDVADTVKDLTCVEDLARPSHRLPIQGRIGLTEVIDEFVELRGQKPMSLGKFIRELRFTYQIGGNVNPVLTLMPVNHLQRANVLLSANRVDEHKLQVIISAKTQRAPPAEIKIVNDVIVVSEKDEAETPVRAQRATPRGRRSGAASRRSVIQSQPSADDTKNRLLREQDYQRSITIQNEVLDRLGPIP